MSSQSGSTLLEFALAWPVLLLLALGSVQLGVWSAESFAVRSAAAAGARAGSAVGAGPGAAAAVTLATLRPSLAGVALSRWCPGDPPGPPAGVWVCASPASGAVRVRVAGRVPALVPLAAGRDGLPVRADVSVQQEVFR